MLAHDGRHDDVMIPFVQHNSFPTLLKLVKEEATSRLCTGGTMAFVFWCDHGKHRSVCAAELFGHVFARVLSPNVSIRHLTQEMRNSRHWKQCPECWNPKLTVVEKVVAMWLEG